MNVPREKLIPRVPNVTQRGMLTWLDTALCWLTIAALMTLTLSLIYQVIARYAFDRPTTWSEEVAVSLFVWVSMLAVPLGFRRGEHLAIDILSRRLSPLPLKLLATGVSALSGLALAVIGIYAVKLLPAANRQILPGLDGGLGIPAKVSWVYAAVPVGCAIALLFIAERLWAVWANRVLVLNADADSQVVDQLEDDLSNADNSARAADDPTRSELRDGGVRHPSSHTALLSESSTLVAPRRKH